MEAKVQEITEYQRDFHITRNLTPPTLKTHCIFLSCPHNYFSMACKLLWRPEASTEPFEFMLKCCHLMDLINTAAAPCLLLPFLVSGIKLMLYLLQSAQPDFPSCVTRCLAGSTSQAASLVTMGSCQCSKLQGWQQPPAARLPSSTEQEGICHASGAEHFPWFHFQMLCWVASGTFLSCTEEITTVKYSERRMPEVKDAVNMCSSSTQW